MPKVIYGKNMGGSQAWGQVQKEIVTKGAPESTKGNMVPSHSRSYLVSNCCCDRWWISNCVLLPMIYESVKIQSSRRENRRGQIQFPGLSPGSSGFRGDLFLLVSCMEEGRWSLLPRLPKTSGVEAVVWRTGFSYTWEPIIKFSGSL